MVLGVGVAGLQAIATARRLGAEVEAFDIRPEVADQVRSLGATFIEVEDEQESSDEEESEHNAGPGVGRTERFVKALLGLPPEFGRRRERSAESGQGAEEEQSADPQDGYAHEQDEEKTMMLFSDAREGLEEVLEAVKKS